MIAKIISGGQTGADRAALDWAIFRKVPHAGWCPNGRKDEDGPIPECYKLKESTSSDFLQQIEWNARDSDGTVIFSIESALTGGSLKTQVFASKHKKPCVHIHQGLYHPESALSRFVIAHKIKSLNVAGPMGSKEPSVYDFVFATLDAVFFPVTDSVLGEPDEG